MLHTIWQISVVKVWKVLNLV